MNFSCRTENKNSEYDNIPFIANRIANAPTNCQAFKATNPSMAYAIIAIFATVKRLLMITNMRRIITLDGCCSNFCFIMISPSLSKSLHQINRDVLQKNDVSQSQGLG